MRVNEKPRPSGSEEVAPPLLQVHGISKTYRDTVALSNVEFDVGPGSVHALLGSNGSGKSTLCRILAGAESPDRGSVFAVNGVTVRNGYTVQNARDLGVAAVHQNAPLVDSATCAEMLGLGTGFATTFGALSRSRMRRQFEELSDELQLGLNPDALVSALTPADRVMLSMAMVFADTKGAERSLLILDEVTSPLKSGDASRVLELARREAGRGVAVLVVTHRLQEVLDHCTSVTVLSDGHLTLHGDTTGMDEARLRAALGGPLSSPDAIPSGGETEPGPVFGSSGGSRVAIQVNDLSGAHIQRASLTVRAGECVGVTGDPFLGPKELARTVVGSTNHRREGRIQLGEPTGSGKPKGSSVVYVSGDRQTEGGFPLMSVGENLLMTTGHRLWGRYRRARQEIDSLISEFRVKPPHPKTLFGQLSGGNQQKVIFSRAVSQGANVMVLNEPTVGIDTSTREYLYSWIKEEFLQKRNGAVLLVSSDSTELRALCTRILIMKDDVIVDEISGEGLTHERIAAAILGDTIATTNGGTA